MLCSLNAARAKRLKQNNTLHVFSGVFFVIISFVLAFYLYYPSVVGAASSPSYNYYDSGSKIGAKGGQFGDATIQLDRKTAGSKVYTGKVQIVYTYNTNWNLFKWAGAIGIGNKTATCVAGVQVSVNSSNENKASISTPASLNNPGTVFKAKDSTYTGPCTSDIASSMSDFNKGSIVIGGSTSSKGGIGVVAETDNTRQISVTVYSEKSGSDLKKIGLKASLTDAMGKAIKSTDFTTDGKYAFDDKYSVNQSFFKDISPGKYKICLTPASTFSFAQCQNVTKAYNAMPDVRFGTPKGAFNINGKIVSTLVNISVPDSDQAGTYGPISLEIIKLSSISDKSSGSYLDTEITDSIEVENTTKSNPVILNAKFDLIEAGFYKLCISKSALCSSNFKKETNWESSPPATQINVPASKSSDYFVAKSATCAIDGIGWIVCPTMKFMGGISDGAFGLVSQLLSIKPNLVASGSASGTFVAWQYFRDIANVVFVVAFMIIIFSQLTSVGISNYGVKKMIPRLVITAILVNVSFYVCQIAVDISEILGHSLNIFIGTTIPEQIKITATTQTWDKIITGAVGGTVLSIGGVALAGAAVVAAVLSVTLPVLLAVLLSLLLTLIILIGRQAAIVILIVIAPLAFVAYLLPNTEKWFKKWYTTFGALLMVYPIVALLFGGGKLTGIILNNAAGGDFLIQLMALGVTSIPLIVVPSLLKGAMSATGSIGAKLNGWSSKANGGIGNRLKDSTKIGTGMSDALNYRQQQRMIGLAKGRGNGKGINKLFNAVGGGKYANYSATRGAALENKEFEEGVAASATSMQGRTSDQMLGTALDANASSEQRTAAIRHVMKNGNFEQRSKVLESSHTADANGRAAIRDGYFAKGDNQFYGAALGDQLMGDAKVDLNAGMDSQLTGGKVSASTLVADADATGAMAARAKVLGTADERQRVQAQLKALAISAQQSPATSSLVTQKIENQFQSIRELGVPEGPPVPPSAPPADYQI